ncbi:hypothetical protein [Rhizobium sp. R339]|uniref:hypothetical protein n=1 Tax=Rhizobium sp. R339 TaxID=1764273 RepID=UPI00112FFC67|nr:hypothetical protein [Rhizobium sp. R339]
MTTMTDRVNDPSKDGIIVQTGSGIPDGSGAAIDASGEGSTRSKRGAVEREEKEDLQRQLACPKHGTA